jgi:hypothetical protein
MSCAVNIALSPCGRIGASSHEGPHCSPSMPYPKAELWLCTSLGLAQTRLGEAALSLRHRLIDSRMLVYNSTTCAAAFPRPPAVYGNLSQTNLGLQPDSTWTLKRNHHRFRGFTHFIHRLAHGLSNASLKTPPGFPCKSHASSRLWAQSLTQSSSPKGRLGHPKGTAAPAAA